MKKLRILIGILILSAGATGCSSTYRASAGYANDDIYALHDKTDIARKQQAAAEAKRAVAEARRAEWEAQIAEAQAAAAQDRYYESSDSNPYEDVLADDYESAYARRLRGFESPTYKMPSSYYNVRYGSTFNYLSAYDPAFYNIIISGDEVWVEPKYVTSMFGSWGGSVYPGGWNFGFSSPYNWWGYPSYGWGYPSFGWGSWGWGIGYHPWHNPWYNSWCGPSWGHHHGWHGSYPRSHNYRLDGPSGRGNSGRGNSFTSGRGNNFNSGRGSSYNSGRGSSSNSGRGSSYNSDRGSSYNSGRSSGSSSSSSSSSSGSSYGGSRGGGSSSGSSGGGGRSYGGGR